MTQLRSILFLSFVLLATSFSACCLMAQHVVDAEESIDSLDSSGFAKAIIANSKLTDELQTELDEFVELNGFPGATLAVAMPDGQVISLASGFEDEAEGKEMPKSAPMMLGSSGKTMVSAVALQLVSEGKFKLDDSLGKYFDGEDADWLSRLPNAKSLTLRSIMNHTSGIPRYIFQSEFLNALKEDPEKDWLPRECVALILDKTPLHETGNGWGYSDTNYLLLGMAIEKVTGKTFYDLAKERLLNPLGLKNTIPSTQSKLPSLCQGHIGSQNPFGLPPKTVKNGRYCLNPKFEWCGGGFVSTVDDLAVWLRALHGGDMLKNEQYEQLIRAVDFRTGLDTDGDGYGLGTFVWQTDSGKFLGHAGMMPGYLTQIEYSCEHKFAIALQTNSDETMGQKHHGMVQQLASSVVKYLESN